MSDVGASILIGLFLIGILAVVFFVAMASQPTFSSLDDDERTDE